MTSLTETVNKLRKTMSVKRKSATVSSADARSVSSLFTHRDMLSDISDDSLSSDNDDASEEDESSSLKRQRVDSEQETETTEKVKESDSVANKKMEKLKQMESHFKKEKKLGERFTKWWLTQSIKDLKQL